MTTPWIPPRTGDIVYLTSCIIDVGVSALTTPPDTPNQYTAALGVAGDSGDMNLDAVMGASGPDGQPVFALQYQRIPLVDNPDELPVLTDEPTDIGKFWLIDELDENGFYLTTWAYIWWGSFYRQIMMGTVGSPGQVPEIDPLIDFVPPGTDPAIKVSGSSAAPTWQFLCPSPTGAPGPAGYIGEFPDVNEVTTPPVDRYVLSFTGDYTGPGSALPGAPVWTPFNIEQFLPQTYSMPQASFTPYTGVSQQANIGAFTLPAQTFPWTPLVWGHLAAGGLSLGSDPLRIGAQVLLNDETVGTMVARGIGTTIGAINIYPHYSTPQNPNANIQPKNGYAAVPAGQEATIYINLWNDGQLGFYSFTPNAPLPAWQQALDSLGGFLGNPVATIESVVQQLSSYVGSVPTQIQAALNSVAALIGQSPVGEFINSTIDDVAQYLTQFQPLVTQLADFLGITALEQTISNIASQLQSWESTITAEFQNTLDSIANQLGIPGLGNATQTVADTLNSLQPELQHLADVLGGNPITGIISLLGEFGGTVTGDVQDAIDAVAGPLGLGTGLSPSGLQGQLATFQGLLDDVANAAGLDGIGHGINEVIGVVAPFVSGVVGDVLQPAIDAVVNFLGTTGIGHTILELIDQLLELLGNLFSGYTSDAQLYIQVQPLLELEFPA